MCIYIIFILPLNETKKGGKRSKNSNLKRGNIGIGNMHKKYRRQDRDPRMAGSYTGKVMHWHLYFTQKTCYQPLGSLSCLLYFICMLAIPIFPPLTKIF